jgi:hypothetical protein
VCSEELPCTFRICVGLRSYINLRINHRGMVRRYRTTVIIMIGHSSCSEVICIKHPRRCGKPGGRGDMFN